MSTICASKSLCRNEQTKVSYQIVVLLSSANFRSDQRGRFRKALEKFRERYFTSTLQSTMMRTSRTNGTINTYGTRTPRSGQDQDTMDMDMQDFKIKFDENTIDLNDDYRINVKLIPRVAWKKNLDSQYRTPSTET